MSPAPGKASVVVTDAELLRVLMDELPDAIYFKDLQSRFIRINRALAKWYGIKDPQEAIGKSDADYFSKDFAKITYETEQEVIRTGTPQIDVEEKCVWPDGRVTWAKSTKLPLKDASGATIGTFGLSRDCSVQLAAEKEIRRSEAMYRSLVDNLPQNFFRKDKDGKVIFANRQYCTTLGKPLKELIGKTDFDLFPSEMARKYVEDDKRVMQTGVAFETVEAHKPPGKKTIYVRVVKTPVHDQDNKVVGVQGIFWEVPSADAK